MVKPPIPGRDFNPPEHPPKPQMRYAASTSRDQQYAPGQNTNAAAARVNIVVGQSSLKRFTPRRSVTSRRKGAVFLGTHPIGETHSGLLPGGQYSNTPAAKYFATYASIKASASSPLQVGRFLDSYPLGVTSFSVHVAKPSSNILVSERKRRL